MRHPEIPNCQCLDCEGDRIGAACWANPMPLPDPQDIVSYPPHYLKHPSGVECIQITEHMNFCLGNAIKYIWRAGEKGAQLEDLRKARWYLDREIVRIERRR